MLDLGAEDAQMKCIWQGLEQHLILVSLLLREVLDAPEDRFWRMKLMSGIGGDEEKGLGSEDFYQGLGKREDGGK
jgi:hypothetical protein